METIARFAVLLSCAAVDGTLLVVPAGQGLAIAVLVGVALALALGVRIQPDR